MNTRNPLPFIGFMAVVTFVAGMVLPTVVFWIYVGIVYGVGCGVAAATWYENAIRSEAEAFSLRIDNIDLAQRLHALIARHAEVLDENVLLSDQLDLPVPYVVADAQVIPFQRTAGDQS